MPRLGLRVDWLLRLGVVALITTSPAFGQTEAERDQARALMDEGDALVEKKMLAEALVAYQKAHTIMGVPTTGIEVARMLASLGRLAEARQLSTEIAKLPVLPDEPAAFAEARQEADVLARSLEIRLPRLTVDVAAGVRVYIDGAEVPDFRPGEPFVLDPGAHVVEARVNDKNASQRIRLIEGEKKSVKLRFEEPKPQRPLPPPVVERPKPAKPPPLDRSQPSSTSVTLGWVGIAVGGAGLVFGGVTGGLALSKKSDLDDAGCVDRRCPPSRQDDVDRYNTLRTLSGVGLIGGAVITTAGALLVGFGGSSPKQSGRANWVAPAAFAF
jgi:hypothetical protein